MKQYQLWIWDTYYPDPGACNYEASFDSMTSAVEAGMAQGRRWGVTSYDAEHDRFVWAAGDKYVVWLRSEPDAGRG